MSRFDDVSIDDLRRLSRIKQSPRPKASPMGEDLIEFFKGSVQKRQTKLAKLAECWEKLVPPTLSDHCALEGYSRGTLTVIVDSASHLYEMKQLLLAGLEKQLQIAAKSAGLKKVVLRSGRWYSGDAEGAKKPAF